MQLLLARERPRSHRGERSLRQYVGRCLDHHGVDTRVAEKQNSQRKTGLYYHQSSVNDSRIVLFFVQCGLCFRSECIFTTTAMGLWKIMISLITCIQAFKLGWFSFLVPMHDMYVENLLNLS